MTTFDGTTDQHYAPDAPVPLDKAPADENDTSMDMSALEQLRAIVENQDEPDPWVTVIAKGLVRITCSTSIDNSDYQRWTRASMPRTGRRRGTPDVTQMNQLVLTSRAILSTCDKVEVRNPKIKKVDDPGAWVPVTDPATGAVLRLDDDKMLTTFRTPDAAALVIKLFGRDSDVIASGLELLEAAGYIPGDGDEPDPT